MEDIKNKLIESLLRTITYDDMTDEQMMLVVEYETEVYKRKIDELKQSMNVSKIKELIHEWWLDYQIADRTEDNLFNYIS